MSNDQGSVRCLKRNILVLEISSKVRSPSILCGEVLRLFEAPSQGEGFTFVRRITLFD